MYTDTHPNKNAIKLGKALREVSRACTHNQHTAKRGRGGGEGEGERASNYDTNQQSSH